MKRKPTILASLGIAAAVTLASGQALAGDPVSCAAYATIAVSQNESNLSSSCGFGGPRWQSNYAVHYGWCMSVPASAADSEQTARVNQLQGCVGTGWPEPVSRRCNVYAVVAIGQQDANLTSNCGFGGPRWQSNYAAHFNWCRAVPEHAARSELDARTSQLEACAP